MKVLFVCRANSGRSQIAMELYNRLHPGEAYSAGISVESPGQQLKYRPTSQIGISIMKELGIDMSNNRRTQLTPGMINEFDKVIVLAESEVIPSYLYGLPNVEIRSVEDIRYKSQVEARHIREVLWSIVQNVSASLHPTKAVPTS
jgi:protein-tyrosine-phosphatase